jgi:hypothetical protein
MVIQLADAPSYAVPSPIQEVSAPKAELPEREGRLESIKQF